MDMGGTMSAEHGVGLAKAPYLKREVGDLGIEVMQTIKKAMDPNNILNPGKLGMDDSIGDIYDQCGFDALMQGLDQVEDLRRGGQRDRGLYPVRVSAAWAAPPMPRPPWRP